MSTISVQPSKDAAASVAYVLYGNDKAFPERLRSRGQTRAAAIALSMQNGSASPAEFAARAQRLAKATGRTNELYSYVLAFHPDEFDVTNPADMEHIRDIAAKLTGRMHSADYLVVVHADSAGGHGHAHILVINHDNLTGKALQRFTSWKRGLHQLNDELMREERLRVLPDPTQPKPGWEQRREAFAAGGFEQTLGDTIFDALHDPRAVDQATFERLLGEQCRFHRLLHGLITPVPDERCSDDGTVVIEISNSFNVRATGAEHHHKLCASSDFEWCFPELIERVIAREDLIELFGLSADLTGKHLVGGRHDRFLSSAPSRVAVNARSTKATTSR